MDYQERKKKGICHLCRIKIEPQCVYCESCRVRRMNAERARRAVKIRICPVCQKNKLAFGRKRCSECSDTHGPVYKAYQKAWRDKQKLDCFNAYGGCLCACCGEKELAFLTLDHVNNDGAKQRKEIERSGGWRFFIWLKQRKYPAGFQVLCCNCNRGRWMNGGICPHKENR